VPSSHLRSSSSSVGVHSGQADKFEPEIQRSVKNVVEGRSRGRDGSRRWERGGKEGSTRGASVSRPPSTPTQMVLTLARLLLVLSDKGSKEQRTRRTAQTPSTSHRRVLLSSDCVHSDMTPRSRRHRTTDSSPVISDYDAFLLVRLTAKMWERENICFFSLFLFVLSYSIT
jgi:hypothetical protein